MIHSPALDELFEAAMDLMHELVPGVARGAPPAEEAVLWRERYSAAVARLADAGLQVRPDAAAGADDYVALRSEWDRPVHDLATAMLYDCAPIERTRSPTPAD